MARTICVLGVSGYVGAHVAAAALAKGYDARGGLRDSQRRDTSWLKKMAEKSATGGATLTLHDYEIGDEALTRAAMEGAMGVVCAAGTEKREPATSELMPYMAETVCDAAYALGIPAIFTSSTGSTNPPEGDPEIKNEIDHWSDPDLQLRQKKFAPLGKTRLDRMVLAKMDSRADFRGATINPSMICGPCWQAEPARGLLAYARIIKGEAMAEKIPNGSMSMIDVRDLAELHLAALLKPEARGRYFGVKASWHWRDILAAIKRQVPDYALPPTDPDETPAPPTRFDLTRQKTLGVAIRDLDEIIKAHIDAIRAVGLI